MEFSIFSDDGYNEPQVQEWRSLLQPQQEMADDNGLGFIWRGQRPSQNIIDLRGYQNWYFQGNITWGTWWHLASSTPGAIANALRRVQGVFPLRVSTAGTRLSTSYFFEVALMVDPSVRNVRAAVLNMLSGLGQVGWMTGGGSQQEATGRQR